MNCGQLIEYSIEIFFFKNGAENEVGGLDPDIFVFQKSFICFPTTFCV